MTYCGGHIYLYRCIMQLLIHSLHDAADIDFRIDYASELLNWLKWLYLVSLRISNAPPPLRPFAKTEHSQVGISYVQTRAYMDRHV